MRLLLFTLHLMSNQTRESQSVSHKPEALLHDLRVHRRFGGGWLRGRVRLGLTGLEAGAAWRTLDWRSWSLERRLRPGGGPAPPWAQARVALAGRDWAPTWL